MSPRAFTPTEVRQMFLDHLRALVGHWSSVRNVHHSTEKERMAGLIHSVLCTLDGVSMGFPACDVIVTPHEDDKAFHEADGCDYFDPAGTALHGEGDHCVMLYEEWAKVKP